MLTTKHIIVPLILFSLLYLLYKLLFIHDRVDIIDFLLCKNSSFIHLYWFLWAMLWIRLVYYVLNKVCHQNSYLIFALASATVALFFWLKLGLICSNLPLCIGNVPYLMPFFALGVVVKNTGIRVSIYDTVLLLIVSVILNHTICDGVSYALLSFGSNWLINYIQACIGILMIVGIAQYLEKIGINSIEKIGKESLWIYLIHGFFFWGAFKKIISYFVTNNLCMFILTILSAISTVGVIYLIVSFVKSIKKRIILKCLTT